MLFFKEGACLLVVLLLSTCATLPFHGGERASRDAVLENMNKGLSEHYNKEFTKSNNDLTKAEDRIDVLYTRSISRETASLMINDYTIPYRGEDFENIMINLFMALNYVFMGDWNNALVEARKVDHKLNLINEPYLNDKNRYGEDAFVRFMMGLLYESQAEINNAFISYMKAEEAYSLYQSLYGMKQVPRILVIKLMNTAYILGFEDRLRDYRRKYPDLKPSLSSGKATHGEVFVIHYNGLCPRKVSNSIAVILPDKYILRIAIPAFQRRSYLIKKSRIILQVKDGDVSYQADSELCEDIGAIAIENLKDRIARIKAKAIARATTKYLATKKTGQIIKKEKGEDMGQLAEFVMNIFSVISERADTRYCDQLPDKIELAYFKVPPGKYSPHAKVFDASGSLVEIITLPELIVSPGKKSFVSFRTEK